MAEIEFGKAGPVLPHFFVKARLPSPSGFSASPSGDTDYEAAFRNAISAVLPSGFEVVWPRANQKWPVDSDGLTWIPLQCSDRTVAVATYIERVGELEKYVERIRAAVG